MTWLFPERSWIEIGHRLLLHGRYVCLAKRPLCEACCLNEICPAASAPPEGSTAERARGEAQKVAAGLAASLGS